MDIYLFSDLNGKRNTGTFYEKYLQKTNPEESRAEKVIKKMVINYMLNIKDI